MNILEMIVLAVFAIFILIGYHNGFLRVVYSLFAWILVFVFVSWSTPYVTGFIEKNTTLKSAIQEKCVDYLENMTEENADALLPEMIMDKIGGSGVFALGGILSDFGVYDELADTVAHFIIQGIVFFLMMTIGGIAAGCLAKMLDLASHLPALEGVNKALGAATGVVKGLVVVWLAFYAITLFAGSGAGDQLLVYVRESPFLTFLYDHNYILALILFFL